MPEVKETIFEKMRREALEKAKGSVEDKVDTVVDAIQPAAPEVAITPVTELSDGEFEARAIERGYQKPTAELTEAQKKKLADKAFLEKATFAVEKELASKEELIQMQQILATPEDQIAFSVFAAEERRLNKDISGEDIKIKFDRENFQTPEFDEEFKERGKNRIKNLGLQAKNQVKARLDQIDQEFNKERTLQQNVNQYSNAVTKYVEQVSDTYTETYKFGKDEVELTTKLENRKDVQDKVREYLLRPDIAEELIRRGKQNDEGSIKAIVDDFISRHYRDRIANVINEHGRTVGLKEGKVGVPNRISDQVIEGALEDEQKKKERELLDRSRIKKGN